MSALGTGVGSLWTSAGASFDPYFRRVTGTLAVAHAVARRFVTPVGSLSWDRSAGYDIREELNEGIDLSSRADLIRIESRARGEALKDERVESATATATFNASTETLTIEIECETAEGPFTLVLAVSVLTVALLEIRG